MITSILRGPGGAIRRGLTPDEIARALREREGLFWIDIHPQEPDEGRALLRDIFGFHQLTIDDCFNAHLDPPKVDNYGAYLFAIVHDVSYTDGVILLRELDLYVGANYVVTFHQERVRAVDDVRRRAENDAPVLAHGPGFLAHALIDVVVDDFHPAVEGLDDVVSELEDRILEAPDRRTPQRLLGLRRSAQRLKRSIQSQRDLIARFTRGEYEPLIPPASVMYFRDVHDHLLRVDEMVDAVRDTAENALNAYFSEVNNRTNDVVRTLTIVSVIFLPLTLIASVYGTNFEDTFPAYDARWGFYAMAGAFIMIILSLAVFFRVRRWW